MKKIAAEVAPDLTSHCGAEIYLRMMSLEKTGRKDHSTLSWDALCADWIQHGERLTGDSFSLGPLAPSRWQTPVVAHIERYKCLEKNEERVQEMIDMGCPMQINSSSVLKPRLFGDEQKQLKTSSVLLEKTGCTLWLVICTMWINGRLYMAEAYRLIKEEYSENNEHKLSCQAIKNSCWRMN